MACSKSTYTAAVQNERDRISTRRPSYDDAGSSSSGMSLSTILSAEHLSRQVNQLSPFYLDFTPCVTIYLMFSNAVPRSPRPLPAAYTRDSLVMPNMAKKFIYFLILAKFSSLFDIRWCCKDKNLYWSLMMKWSWADVMLDCWHNPLAGWMRGRYTFEVKENLLFLKHGVNKWSLFPSTWKSECLALLSAASLPRPF